MRFDGGDIRSSADLAGGRRRGTDNYSSTGSRVERHSLREKRMLRVSFNQITDVDPLGLKKKYVNAQDHQYLESFYTTCALIPITVILGTLFYGLWFMSPNTRNLKIYQQDIY
jgi:hypothetical protein